MSAKIVNYIPFNAQKLLKTYAQVNADSHPMQVHAISEGAYEIMTNDQNLLILEAHIHIALPPSYLSLPIGLPQGVLICDYFSLNNLEPSVSRNPLYELIRDHMRLQALEYILFFANQRALSHVLFEIPYRCAEGLSLFEQFSSRTEEIVKNGLYKMVYIIDDSKEIMNAVVKATSHFNSKVRHRIWMSPSANDDSFLNLSH